ncbi:leucine-rich repeat and guanylate kinase domain-containing protein-like isoform X1 [Temnothorax curvispinosus]|uniref:Dynein axonemal assembly factor 1 homolog n=1 Tax=Temnothorax curvispinosus TaxID=300111 RepID=A0A6J1Q8I0_9HYME|nr:leucine-rich repeat and guanylate kinase domain-containing protein-like isoform X1 [Temnothorax curvispinosus]XP_024877181.1 leucine-rich repeat and guanylate kinase domain-containing protein-like isoform X1 [Temnothorax curvispinosus]XP_024877182.1 leucine-rich repeat and guanylate kinase domain-containing protein-like isoform X1 [Temnothorax curvispinosus]
MAGTIAGKEMLENTPDAKRVPYERSKDNSVARSQLTPAISAAGICSGWKPSPLQEQKQQIIDSDWGGYALDLDLWEDSKSPVVQIRPDEVSLDDKESSGFLSDRLIGIGSSFLARSPENGLYILSKCILKNRGLTDIVMLRHHRHLQYINVASNNISCLSPLSGLRCLMYLNASHNQIDRVSNFVPPWYLTYVNLSYNHMTDIGDLRNCWSIVRLNLSHNNLEIISGLENLKHLRYLNLSYNLIECIENLDGLNIRELNLEGNCITSFRSSTPGHGINTLLNLRTILLGHNRLSTLGFFKDAYSLRFVDLKFNRITDLLEVFNLKGSIFEVDFRGNTCTKWPNYRNVLISSIPSVKFIDGVEVFPEEKVTSTMLFASPLDLIAARKVAKLTLLEQLNISKVDAHVQPYDEISPPLMILTGPSALKKMALALHVAQTIPDKIKYCRWHTTKEICENDDERKAHIPVNREEFNDMARRGEFLVILDLLGDSYGFHVNQISPLISERKIGLTQMNLYAVTEISKRYPNVKAILMFTHSVNLHRDWIREKFDVYTWIKDSVENLLAVKIGKHREEETETASCILSFIEEILDEIMCRLEFPIYCISVRPQGNGSTTTDIILQSKTMLPKVVLRRSEVVSLEKKRITLTEARNGKLFDRFSSEEKRRTTGELKVLLDEESNIIVDDEETKREERKSKMLLRRTTLVTNMSNHFDDDDLGESTSSEEATENHEERLTHEEKTEALKNTYVELVIKSRKLYLDYHESHPGFFILVLLMDNYTKAFDSLIDFIHESYTSLPYRKSIFLSEIQHFRHTVIPIMLENIVDEIRENLSISKLQRRRLLKLQEIDCPQNNDRD